MGTKRMNCHRPEQMDIKEFSKMVEKNSNSRRRKSASHGGKRLEDRKTKEKNHKKGVSETCEQVCNGRFHDANSHVES